MLSSIYIGLNVNYLLFLSHFNNCLLFPTEFLKLFQTSFIKTHPMPVDLFHTDTQIDGQKDGHNDANSLFSQAFLRF
jgi:hypothetical protein